MMNYFIFNFEQHTHLISSFLSSASIAHNHSEKKNKDWFNWKFRDNPYGETILACAEHNDEIVGCVAYGIQLFWLHDKEIKGALAFENFVHPEYQRKGIFKKLISLSENETKLKNINFLFVFPNRNSLPGYERMGWNRLSAPEYWIKGKRLSTVPLSLKDIRKGFKPLPSSNLENLNSPINFQQSPVAKLNSVITPDYLKWRFFTYPFSKYIIIDNKNYYSILRLGKRGNIKEAQVLFVNIQDEELFSFSDFLKECKLKAKYDIISFSISKKNPLRKHIKRAFFVKVPNHTNVCFKILNEKRIREEDIQNISLSAINYHTY